MVVYADNGDAPVSPRRLGDLLLLVGGLSGAFERVLRQAKRIRAVAPPLGVAEPPGRPAGPGTPHGDRHRTGPGFLPRPVPGHGHGELSEADLEAMFSNRDQIYSGWAPSLDALARDIDPRGT